ncbi:MAG: acyl-CoA dehydrogenase family protein [Henriciella sp.]|uniref:acyl-CoA dehydrogenase family protein n=1 Tax=Henriciella sp. TaxID=1968823 RepID=UPI0032EFE7CD
MTHHAPLSDLETHTVTNQPPPFEDVNLYETDRAMRDAVTAFGGALHAGKLSAFGETCGRAETQRWARQANENPPKLKSFDRYGHRLDEVEFHPAYHELMALGLDSGISGAAWEASEAGHVLHGAMMMLMMQADAGVTCPMSMTYACVAALKADPDIAATWTPRVTAQSYDPRFIPASEKTGVTIGMAMTEKQGGSDVRANTTKAEPAGDGGYILTGHKWFCSAPMSDAFLTLAYAEGGMTCFLVPRWRPDGTRNGIHVMRLKDKLGDKSNASSEVEYHGAWAERLGEEGRGIRTIIDMVQHTRYDCTLGSAGGMRAALTQALWHTSQRRAFQKSLIDQPAMRAVLADLVIESEAATALALRIGASLDRAGGDEQEAAFMRLATPLAKYWVCKRQPGFVYEALECHGGAGYVEEGAMPRLFRQSPLNAIWEGSGNVIALDILRALSREPESLKAVQAEFQSAMGRNGLYDRHCEKLADFMEPGSLHEGTARAFAQEMALALQGAALAQCAPDFAFDGFCQQRLAPGGRGFVYGDVAEAVDIASIIERAMPA